MSFDIHKVVADLGLTDPAFYTPRQLQFVADEERAEDQKTDARIKSVLGNETTVQEILSDFAKELAPDVVSLCKSEDLDAALDLIQKLKGIALHYVEGRNDSR